MEIEAKYTATEAQFARLLKADTLGDYILETSEEQYVTDHYMDTANRDIWRGGYACRIREKSGQWLATVKGLGGAEEAIHKREEYEMEIRSAALPHQWPEGTARDLVISLTCSRPIVELCVIRQHRVMRALHYNQRRIGIMSLDVVDVGPHTRHERIYEVEIELEEDGTMEDLQVLDGILQGYGLHPESRSKFERAMALFDQVNGESVECAQSDTLS